MSPKRQGANKQSLTEAIEKAVNQNKGNRVVSPAILKWILGSVLGVGLPVGGYVSIEGLRSMVKEAVKETAPSEKVLTEGNHTLKNMDEKLGKLQENFAVFTEKSNGKTDELQRQIAAHDKQLEKMQDILERMREAGADKKAVERLQDEIRELQRWRAKVEAEKGK